MSDLRIYKTHSLVILPQFATKESACFDVAFQGYGKGTYKGFQQNNSQFERPLSNNEVCIMPPTNTIHTIVIGINTFQPRRMIWS